jgi:hypothetical protein
MQADLPVASFLAALAWVGWVAALAGVGIGYYFILNVFFIRVNIFFFLTIS